MNKKIEFILKYLAFGNKSGYDEYTLKNMDKKEFNKLYTISQANERIIRLKNN